MVVENGFTTTGVLGDPVYHSGQVFGHCMEPVSDSPATEIMVSRAGSVFRVLGEVRPDPISAQQKPKQSEPNKNGDSFPYVDLKMILDYKINEAVAAVNAAMIARDGHRSFTPQSYIDAKTPPTPKAPQQASVSAAALMITYSDDPKTGRRHGFGG